MPDNILAGITRAFYSDSVALKNIQLRRAYDEIKRLRERLGPRGLEVVMIGDTGHYVSKDVKKEIESLRRTLLT